MVTSVNTSDQPKSKGWKSLQRRSKVLIIIAIISFVGSVVITVVSQISSFLQKDNNQNPWFTLGAWIALILTVCLLILELYLSNKVSSESIEDKVSKLELSVETLRKNFAEKMIETDKNLKHIRSVGTMMEKLIILSDPLCVEGDDVLQINPIEYIEKNLTKWAFLCNNLPTKELWKRIYRLYVMEENKDICECGEHVVKIATNIQIYTDLLREIIRYFLDRYKDDAEIVVLTALLPSSWYNRGPVRWEEEEFLHVEEYRQELERIINECRGWRVSPLFERYILYTKSKDHEPVGFMSWEELEPVLKETREHVERYIREIHLKEDNARIWNIKEAKKWPPDYKDVLIFGHKKSAYETQYSFLVKSTMDPQFPVMFVELEDHSNIQIAGLEAHDLMRLIRKTSKRLQLC